MVNRGRLHNTMKNLKDEIEGIVGDFLWLETQAFTTGAVTQQYVKWDDLFTQLFDTGKQITSLIEQEKEMAVMGFIDYMYGQNLPLHKAGVVTVRAFAKQYLAERNEQE